MLWYSCFTNTASETAHLSTFQITFFNSNGPLYVIPFSQRSNVTGGKWKQLALWRSYVDISKFLTKKANNCSAMPIQYVCMNLVFWYLLMWYYSIQLCPWKRKVLSFIVDNWRVTIIVGHERYHCRDVLSRQSLVLANTYRMLTAIGHVCFAF